MRTFDYLPYIVKTQIHIQIECNQQAFKILKCKINPAKERNAVTKRILISPRSFLIINNHLLILFNLFTIDV